MSPLFLRLATVVVLVFAFFTLGKSDFDPKLVFSEVSRKIDLSTQLAKVSTSLTIKNGGDSNTRYFYLSIEPSLVDKLSYVGVMVCYSSSNRILFSPDQLLHVRPCFENPLCLCTAEELATYELKVASSHFSCPPLLIFRVRFLMKTNRV